MKPSLIRQLHHLAGGILLGIPLLPPSLCGETAALSPLMVTSERPEDQTEAIPGNSVRIDAAALSEAPVQRGTYQDLFDTVANAYGGNMSVGSFSLRGVNQDGLFYVVGTASNPLIPVLEDGATLSVATLRYLPPLLWDLESVELLRGPQLLGPGPASLSGALRLQTGAPGFSNDGKALLEASENRTFRVGIAQDFVLRPDELALRVAFAHRESDDNVTNLYNGDDAFGATRRDRYQARLIWHPNQCRDAAYDLSLVHDESSGNPFGTARAVAGYDLFDRKTALNLDPSCPARRDAVILNATLALPHDLELKSTTALQQLDLKTHFDLDETAVLAWVANGVIDELRFTQDLSVSRDEGVLDWRSGVYLEASSYDLGYSGVGVAPLPSGSPYQSMGQEDVRVLAVYGRGDWEFMKNLHLTGGLRMQHDQREVKAAATVGTRPEAKSTADIADTALLPQIALEWQPDERGKVGLQLARGYHSGGVSFAPSLGTSGPYDPELTWDLDLYGRANPCDTLELSAGLFHSWMDDPQITLDAPGGLKPIDTYTTNAASSRRYGSELEARWKPCAPLVVSGSLGWVHTEFGEFMLDGVDRDGQSFPNAPEWTASLGASYQHPSGFFASTLFSWADATYTDPASPRVTALETRRLLGARLGYSWDHASVYLFGSNLLDADYALAKFDNSAKGQPLAGQIAPARSFGIGCQITW